jgi:hypothetical protein
MELRIFLVRAASLITIRRFCVQIKWCVISRKVLSDLHHLMSKYSIVNFAGERKRKYVFQWQTSCSKIKSTSIATVPDRCLITLIILTQLISRYTVKRVDEVVRRPHLVTQDQNTQVSNKVSDIHVENSIINIELFRHFSQVIELVCYDYISHVELNVCKCRTSSTELTPPGLELAILTSTILYSTTAPHFLPCLRVYWRIERVQRSYIFAPRCLTEVKQHD